jgi:pyridoxamine 5'-phosphate oxidase family protein
MCKNRHRRQEFLYERLLRGRDRIPAEQTMGRLATIGSDGMPHLVPLTYRFNADEDAIDIGGIDFGNTKKWRDMLQNPHVAFLVDDASPAGAHAIEIRGAEPHFIGGEFDQSSVSQFPARVRPRKTAPHRQLGSGTRGLRAACPKRELMSGSSYCTIQSREL